MSELFETTEPEITQTSAEQTITTLNNELEAARKRIRELKIIVVLIGAGAISSIIAMWRLLPQ